MIVAGAFGLEEQQMAGGSLLAISFGLIGGGFLGGALAFVYGVRVLKRPDTPVADALVPGRIGGHDEVLTEPTSPIHQGAPMTKPRTPAQLYALLVGAVLVGAGIMGFFYNASFETGSEVSRDAVLGLLDVNAWHNIVHLTTGALGLATFASILAARRYALGLGAVYLLVTILGLIVGDGGVILHLIPINTEDSVLHAALAIAGLAAGGASSTRGAVRPSHA